MNAPLSPWLQSIAQMQGALKPEHESQRFNPRPAGKMISGSATVRVLAVLREIYPAALPHHELMRRANAERGGVAWAICFLRRKDMIETFTHPGHSRYMRYRYKPGQEGARDDD